MGMPGSGWLVLAIPRLTIKDQREQDQMWRELPVLQHGQGKSEGPDPKRDTYCSTCAHRRVDGLCACRETSDMILRSCPDHSE